MKFQTPKSGVYYLYRLKLKGGYNYIGITKYPQVRLQQHFDGEGANFTKNHKPQRVIELHRLGNMTYYEAQKIETMRTLQIMQYNKRTRGGLYIQEDEDIEDILRCNIIPAPFIHKYEKINIPKLKLPEKPKKPNKEEVWKEQKPNFRAMTFEEATDELWDFWFRTGQKKSRDEAQMKILKKGWYMR